MKYKKTVIFGLITIFVIVVMALSYAKPQILVYNMNVYKINDDIEYPFDLTIIVNDEVVFDDSISVSTLPIAIIDVNFKWGVNHIIAYSTKAKLYDEWAGLYYINNRILVQMVTYRFEDSESVRIVIGRS